MISSAAIAAAASAQDVTFQSTARQTTLIELYSSEGCSSCPPAEESIARWKTSARLWNQVVPVVFHVDYWDQLGWPDRFARPEFTQRQRDYAAQLGQDSIYTPEFIVNAHEWRSWFGGNPGAAASPPTVGILKLTVKNAERVEAVFTPAIKTANPSYHLQIALLGSNLVTQVQRGENEGRTLRHEFVALGFTSIPLPSGENAIAPLPALNTNDKPAAIAAWVVSSDGAFLQATGGWLDPAKNQ